ncbi:hypothetical protein [Actinomadura macrotermitis]|uniref:Uncharacterized protein n=1 Tax=Actinomadura macrotermitis TaxID=2585200 RepID=A0A7K0BXN5_9ACTN|nr:hypothetical protein [Actinomadura macrotermitis]MQY05943.1 hypothetical protein [Actinomadura macrotermitis]
MTQMSPEPAWTAWEQPAPAGGGRRKTVVLSLAIPAAVLTVLMAAVIAFLILTDPANAAGACGGG